MNDAGDLNNGQAQNQTDNKNKIEANAAVHCLIFTTKWEPTRRNAV